MMLKKKKLLHLLNGIYGEPLNTKKIKPPKTNKPKIPWNKKWDKETCTEESKKYTTIKEFKHAHNNAYNVSVKNKWLDEFTWLERQWSSKWNEQTCYEEAKKYSRIIEFQKGNRSAYNAAYKNGWLKTYDWLYEKYREKL